MAVRLIAGVLLLLTSTLAACGGSNTSASGTSPASQSQVVSQPPLLTSIALGPPDAKIAKGLTSHFTATGMFSDGSRKDLTATVTWTSAQPGVASISNAAVTGGLATAVAPGSTTINATLDGVSGATALSVTAAVLTSIGVTPAKPSLAAGLEQQFAATGVYSDSSTQTLTSTVVWSSTEAGVAAVSNATGSNGLTSAISPGSTTMSAALGDVTGAATLTVTSAELTSIGVTPASVSVPAGLKHQFTASGVYTDHSTHDLTASAVWSSTASAIVALSNTAGSNGLASALESGAATIVAVVGAISATASLSVTAATLVSIGVTPASVSVAAGLKPQFTASGLYTDNTTHDLTAVVVWSSSAPAVASLSNAAGFNGLATAVSPGTVTATAALGGVSGAATLTVTAATLVSLGVTPLGATIADGSDQQFTATGTYSDGSTLKLTQTVAWTSSAVTTVGISNAPGSGGLATALELGSASITAALGSASAAATLKVTPVALLSLGVTPSSATIAGGTNQQFIATGIYNDGTTQNLTRSVAWTSSDAATVAISNAPGLNGLATALNPGSATITAALGSVSAATPLSVSTTRLVSMAVTPANPRIAYDAVQQFMATGTFSDYSTQDLTMAVAWNSSDSSVASVSNALGFNGLATGLGQGSAAITAALGSVSGSTALSVAPVALVSLAVTPANLSIPDGTGRQFTVTGTYADDSTRDLTTSVTWTTSDISIASISNANGSKGFAVARRGGATTISAALVGVSGETSLTVAAATLVSIAVTPPFATIANTAAQQFFAIGSYSDMSTQNLTASVTWASSDATVASVSNASGTNGLATALLPGSASITAALAGISSSAVRLAVIVAHEYAYVTNSGDATVSEYTLAAGGALTAMSPAAVPAGTVPSAVVVDPTGRYAYVVNNGDSTVSQYKLAAGGGMNALIPAVVAAGSYPQSMAIDPTGRYAYVANNGDGTVSQYTLGAGGMLTAMRPAFVVGGGSPQSITVDPLGRFAYVANAGGTVSQFIIGTGGLLSAMSPATVAAGGYPQAITVDPTSRYAYVANGFDGTLSLYTIGAGGALSAMSPATVPTDSGPHAVAVDATGRYAYVANQVGTVSQYTISNGVPVAMSPVSVQSGADPQSITVDRTGRYVYVANEGDGTVTQFTILADGTLAVPGSTSVATGSGPYSITTAY